MKPRAAWIRLCACSLAIAGCLAAFVAAGAGANLARSQATGQESAGVRNELSHLAPSGAPLVSQEGNTGGQGALPPIKGTLLPKYSTATAKTYELPDGSMITRVDATPVGSAEQRALLPPTAGFVPSCTLTNTAPTSSSCNQTTMLAGYKSTSKTINRGLIQFSLPKLSVDAEIGTAQLALYLGSSTTTTPAAMGAYRVSSEWVPGATWNTTDGSKAWKTTGGDFSTGADGAINPSVGSTKGWVYWYPTQSVQEWYNGPSAPNSEGDSNFGLLLKDVSEGATNNDLTFETPASGEHLPVLSIQWFPRGVGQQPQFTTLPIQLDDRMGLNVNLASGDLGITNHDLHINGTGPAFEVNRTWNSMVISELKNFLGYGWADSNRPFVSTEADGSILFRDGEGTWFTFVKQGSKYVAPPGLQATLCTSESEKPCSAPPKGVTYRLTFNQSQLHLDFGGTFLKDVQDRYGNTITNPEIGEENGQEEITDTQGRHDLYQWELDAEGFPFITEVTDKSGERAVSYGYEYDASKHHHLTVYKDANSRETKYGYTGDLITKITTPHGDVVKLAYDGEGRVTEIKRTTNAEHTTGPTIKFTYYELGEAPSPCSVHQKATVVSDPDSVTSKSGHTTTYCSNLSDEIETTADSSGNKSESTYNKFGRIATTTAAAPGAGLSGNVASFDYDELGQNLLCTVTGATKAQSTCPASPNKSMLVTSYSYMDEKNPFSATQVQNPQGNSLFGCFNEGHQEGTKAPACPETAAGPAGSLETENDQLPTEHELKFAHNPNGTISSSTDADGHTTSYEYDTKGNLKKIVPPAGSGLGATSITVDADSRPHIVVDGAGHIATISYDKLDRVTQIAYTGTGTARTIKFEYDSDGNITKRVDPTGTTEYTVDPLSRLTKEALPGGLSNEYGYDEASNMTTFTDAGGTVKYAYNGLNELESMTEPGDSKATTFAYDGNHRLTKITYPSGGKETYKLDPTTGRPETITPEGFTGTAVPTLTYSYTQGEHDTSLVQKVTSSTGNTTTYGYDPLNRLTSAITVGTNPSLYEFKLDGAGNRTQQTVNPTASKGGKITDYAVNAGNLLECRQTVAPPCAKSSSKELSAYTYDEAADETAITPKGDSSGSSFGYDAASQLTSLTPTGSGALALEYGGSGQDDLTSIGETTLQNSLMGLTRETTSAGASHYHRTPSGLLVGLREPGGSYNPIYDAQGDVIGLADNLKGEVKRTFSYGPYGENVHSDGTQTVPFPFGFKGGYRLAGGNTGEGNVANGLYHFGQRYYDPTTGRWTQPDPLSQISSPTQGNRFLFAGDDPINASDPTGRLSEAELFEDGLIGLGCASPETGLGLLSCAGGVAYKETEGKPRGVVEEFYEGIEEAASVGNDF